jgi:phage-related protein
MALGEARIEITPDFSGFDTKLKRAVTDSMSDAQKVTDRATQGMAESFKELSGSVARELEGIYRDTNGRLRDVEGRFVKMSTLSQQAIEAISSGDAFSGIETKSKKAADEVEKDFKKAARESEQALDKIGGGLKTIGFGIAGALAGIGLGAFLADATLEAQAANSALANTAQLIESTGAKAGVSQAQIEALATSMLFKIGIDDTAVIEASNVLLTFTQVSGPIFDETIARAADLSSVFGTDLQGATMQLGKALNDPIKGLSALSRSGVSFTAEQKEMIKAMTEGGDVAGAQRMILDELAVQFGGTAEASADSTARISGAFGELKEGIGAGLITALDGVTPALLTLATDLLGPMEEIGAVLGDLAGPLLEAFGPAVGVLIQQFADVLVDIGEIFSALAPLIAPIAQIVGVVATALSGALASAFTALIPVIEIVAEFIDVLADRVGEALFTAIEAVAPVLESLGKTIADALVVVLPVVLDLFDAFAPLLVIVLGLVQKLAPIFTQVAGIMATTFATVLGVIIGLIEQLLPPVADLIADLVAGLAPILPMIALAFQQLVIALLPLLPPLLEIVMTLLPPLSELLLALVPIILELVQGPLDVFVFLIEALVPLLVEVANGIGIVAEYVAELLTWLADAATEVTAFGGIWQVIFANAQIVFEKVRDALVAGWEKISGVALPIIDGLRVAFDVAMKAITVIWDVFSGVALPIIDGLRVAFDVAMKAITVIWDVLTTTLGVYFGIIRTYAEVAFRAIGVAVDVLKVIATVAFEAIRTVVGVVASAVTLAWEGVSAVLGPIFTGIKTVADTAFNGIKATVDTIVGAIKTAFEGLGTAIGAVATGISSAFKTAFRGVASLWNSTVGKLRFEVPSWVPGIGGKGFDVPDIPYLANGTIATSPTLGIFGEAGPEAVIPISRPNRAMELMEQSGLASMVRSQGGPAVMIQNAVFASATDADLVAQRVNAALRVRSFA